MAGTSIWIILPRATYLHICFPLKDTSYLYEIKYFPKCLMIRELVALELTFN